MTTSNMIELWIREIADVSSKNDKVGVLRHRLQDSLFLEVIQYALDPRMRFGIAKKTLDKIEKDVGAGRGTKNWERCSVNPFLMLAVMADGELSGNEAIERLTVCAQQLDAESWSLLRRILLKKPDAGFTASSVNKARPNTVWTFDCMLAHPFEAKRVKSWPIYVEPKIDGVRCLIMVRQGRSGPDIGFFSRTGKEFNSFAGIEKELCRIMMEREELRMRSYVIDCEIDSGSFLDTVSQARRKEEEAIDAVARCFDVVTFEDWNDGRSKADFSTRRRFLEAMLGRDTPRSLRLQVVPQWLAHSEEEIMQINNRIQAEGGEGVIVKPRDHIYERKRSHSWLKIKGFETHDLIITDFFEGTGKYAGALGGVICDYDGVEVRVGGGWSDEDRRVIWADQDDFRGRMIEVGAHETTPDGSLRHPRFIRWRDDKHSNEEAA